MTVRVDGVSLDVPSFIVKSMRGLSAAEQAAVWQELYENIEDMKSYREAVEADRAHPGRRYSQDEIEKEFCLS